MGEVLPMPCLFSVPLHPPLTDLPAGLSESKNIPHPVPSSRRSRRCQVTSSVYCSEVFSFPTWSHRSYWAHIQRRAPGAVVCSRIGGLKMKERKNGSRIIGQILDLGMKTGDRNGLVVLGRGRDGESVSAGNVLCVQCHIFTSSWIGRA